MEVFQKFSYILMIYVRLTSWLARSHVASCIQEIIYFNHNVKGSHAL